MKYQFTFSSSFVANKPVRDSETDVLPAKIELKMRNKMEKLRQLLSKYENVTCFIQE